MLGLGRLGWWVWFSRQLLDGGDGLGSGHHRRLGGALGVGLRGDVGTRCGDFALCNLVIKSGKEGEEGQTYIHISN